MPSRSLAWLVHWSHFSLKSRKKNEITTIQFLLCYCMLYSILCRFSQVLRNDLNVILELVAINWRNLSLLESHYKNVYHILFISGMKHLSRRKMAHDYQYTSSFPGCQDERPWERSCTGISVTSIFGLFSTTVTEINVSPLHCRYQWNWNRLKSRLTA